MSAFLQRYGATFGRSQSMLLRMAGLTEGEATAEGAWVQDTSGRRWLDFGSFGLHLLGHRHPTIVAAAIAQLGRIALSSKVLGNEQATGCAERLKASFSRPLDGVIFGNSGAEAVETALKLARLATGRRRILALKGSYHGKTQATLAISDTMGHLAARDGADVGFVAAGDVAAVADALAEGDVAGIIVEPIQGEGGIVAVDPAFLTEVERLARAAGSLFIVDEIQTGLGRCGVLWYGDHLGLAPDIVLSAKILGGGIVPISAAIYSSRAIGRHALDPIVYASTFAGAAFATRIADTTLDIVAQPDFLDSVRRLGARTIAGLGAALADLPGIVAIRGRGLMIGIEFATADLAGEVVLEAAKRGVLVTFCLSRPAVVRVYPPAVIADADLDLGIAHLTDAVLAALATTELRPLQRHPIEHGK